MGLARSGVAACRLLQLAGARVTVADRKESAELTAILGSIDRDHVAVTVGARYESSLDEADLDALIAEAIASTGARPRRRGRSRAGCLCSRRSGPGTASP